MNVYVYSHHEHGMNNEIRVFKKEDDALKCVKEHLDCDEYEEFLQYNQFEKDGVYFDVTKVDVE